jgi:hypothetical protein
MTQPTKARRQPTARKEAHAAASPAAIEPNAPDPIDADNLEEAFVKALEADFIAHGKKAIEAMRTEKPVEYMKIVATLRMKDANGAVDPLKQMSDAELDRRIEELAAQAGYEIRPAQPPRRDGD